MRLTLEPGPEPEVVAEALHWAETAAPPLRGAVRDRMLLVLGEAVANAVRHGRGTVTVGLSSEASSLKVYVADEGCTLTERVIREASLPSDRQTNGRGLVLIAALADAWSVQEGVLHLTFVARAE